MTPEHLNDLHTGWQIAEVPAGADPAMVAALPADAWLPATVPGSVHGALLAAGRIPDPFIGLNETQVQWVGERTWAWRLVFDVEASAHRHHDLLFDGLDTCAQAWLDGQPILRSDNMFVPQRVAAGHLLTPGRHQLLLRFDPALAQARALEALHGKRALWNGDSARLHLRKAQYHFGWDWGPTLLTCGPWQPVRHQAWDVRIAELALQCLVDAPAGRASLDLAVTTDGDTSGLLLMAELTGPDGRVAARAQGLPGQALQLSVDNARLWWPNGMGEQALYTLVTRLGQGTQVLAEDRRRIGLRTLRLVQAPVAGEAGRSFHFEVNGRDFFVGGANWIPDDSLLERISPARYRQRVAQAAAANMTMLRVWGGGIYESDAFYDACDELGLLVWQDFGFACGLYPAHPAFVASVRAEAEAAVKRLRHRASLALWCGNNEDYAVAESVGQYGPGIPRERFEALALYEGLLPEVCQRLDPQRPYWPGSPYTPGDGDSAPTVHQQLGDRHSWEVWHQQMLPYQRYAEVQGRFVSEFGMQSHPSLALLEAVLPEDERFAQSRTADWHNKAGSGLPDGHRRLAVYLADNLRVGPSLAEQVYATQFIQAEAMRVAYQDFRRRWQQPGARAVGGALVWQLNDCWPATSWALVDSAGTPKPAWHALRRALAPLAVALRLSPGQALCALMNGQASACTLRLQLRLFTLDGQLAHQQSLAHTAAPNSSHELTLALPATDQPLVGELCALDGDSGTELARDCAWPEPFRHHRLGRARLDIRRRPGQLLVEASAPVKGLWLAAPGAEFDDNFIDLMPGALRAIGLTAAPTGAIRLDALDHPTRVLPQDAAGSP